MVTKQQKEKRVSFRVRQQYYDAIVSGEKKIELRKYTPYWKKRLVKEPTPRIAVFVCGKQVHRRWISSLSIETPEQALERKLTEQEKHDVPTEMCIAIELGKVYEQK